MRGSAGSSGPGCTPGSPPRHGNLASGHRRRRPELAHHYLAAGPLGDTGKAVAYARGGRRALRQGAWAEAVRLLEAALPVLSAGAAGGRRHPLRPAGRSGPGPPLRPGWAAEAHRAFDESISLADRIGDEDRVLAAAVAFGGAPLGALASGARSTLASSRCWNGNWTGSSTAIPPPRPHPRHPRHRAELRPDGIARTKVRGRGS